MVYSYESLKIVGISIAGTLLCELLSWFLIYRKSNYKQLVSSITRTGKKLEALKSESAGLSSKTKTQKKKEERLEQVLKQDSFELQKSKMTATVCSSVVLLILYTITSKYFSGQIVAKLPFEAPWIIKGATQRGLDSDDLTDCSMTYVYLICGAGLRPNIQKLLGNTPPRQLASAQQPFQPPKEE